MSIFLCNSYSLAGISTWENKDRAPRSGTRCTLLSPLKPTLLIKPPYNPPHTYFPTQPPYMYMPRIQPRKQKPHQSIRPSNPLLPSLPLSNATPTKRKRHPISPPFHPSSFLKPESRAPKNANFRNVRPFMSFYLARNPRLYPARRNKNPVDSQTCRNY